MCWDCGMAVKKMPVKAVQCFRTCTAVVTRQSSSMLVLIVLLSFVQTGFTQSNRMGRCYDASGRPQRCVPEFVNAAFNIVPEATNTCGNPRIQYCLQTGVTGATKQCEECDARDPRRSHPPRFLTDFNNNDDMTWWQSETMLQGVQYPNSVNITLRLGKSFDITYVRLKFHTSRPESFAIFKRTNDQTQWVPYQFYSASCEETYGRRTREVITRQDETLAICTDEFSDISPLTGGNVAFSTLEGRPSAYNYESSGVLQDWVSATDIMITLTRLNTFGEEVFGDPRVLKSYFYGISDFAVGGRCKCNGHSSECVKSTGQGLEEKLVCQCEHNTAGPDCGECLPFYNDRPWSRATANDAHECQPCDCNQLSNRCYFDEELYRRTGHGGHCLDCRENTAGTHCERCKDNFYRSRDTRNQCVPCGCNEIGSESTQCDENGRCRCKPGVGGDKCDRCAPNFYDFSNSGCRQCACSVAGSANNEPRCEQTTGQCQCKPNVEGQNCDICKPGFFGLDEKNPLGCIPCFCYGHASVCSSAVGYYGNEIHSTFDTSAERWTGIDNRGAIVDLKYDAFVQNIGISARGSEPVYFVAPAQFLGDQRFTYNQMLTFTFRVGEDGARAASNDLIIEGNGRQISAPIFAQGNPIPRTLDQEYKFRLHEGPENQWSPRLSSLEFISVLSNVTDVRIRGTFTPNGVGIIDNIKVTSARRGGLGEAATWVEQCTCPTGYVGQFCESCAPGYRRDPAHGGAFARCVPCNCNKHSDACDVNTGRCICQHNTVGDNCERCAPGYYGYALAGTPDDCKVCPCPDQGECVELLSGDVACINCKPGYAGHRCEFCGDGYHGDPNGRYGLSRPCESCGCNGNIDPNAVANCNTTTGECLKCIYSTGGFYCERCLPGYYGNALGLPKGDQCKDCLCYPPGTIRTGGEDSALTCNNNDGQCPCKQNVVGRRCDRCEDGFWNIASGNGCESCDCDRTGSINRTCDLGTGQCVCKPGVGGRRCDQCQANNYGFSYEGCKACNCDPEGSLSLQCNERTGQCPCKEGTEGIFCDRCQENKYNITAGCIDCPPCYSLVQERVNIHRRKVNELRELIKNVKENPKSVNDTEFRRQLQAVNQTVNDLLSDAKNAVGITGPAGDQLKKLRDAVENMISKCGDISKDIAGSNMASRNAMGDVEEAEDAIMRAEEALQNAENYVENEGQEALRRAREAQEKLGQQSNRMTEIAKQAREEATKQEKDAERIEQTANDALNTSREALRLAQEAIQKPSDTADEIRRLRDDVRRSDGLYNQTRDMAQQAQDRSKAAYDESLNIYTEADSLQLPQVDVPALSEDAARIKTESNQIKSEADRLIEQNADLMADVNRQKQEAEEYLENGHDQQRIADELLAEADAARDIAREALAKVDKTLADANDTLKTLREFDQKVDESKGRAEESLKKIPEIEEKISQAEDKTQEARNALSGAEADAIMARDIAQEAQRTAEMASQDAGTIRNDARDTKDRAMTLKDKADALAEDVAGAQDRLGGFEDQATSDERLAKEALSKAGEAKNIAEGSSDKVKDALDKVNEVLEKLANLDDIDTARLDALEQQLAAAEDELRKADLDNRYNQLMEERERQNQWVREYSDELRQLRLDVENVQAINATIPRTCYRSPVLEP